MECFKIRVPEEPALVGATADGAPARIFPGEYLVHLLKSKLPARSPTVLRFVGADVAGRDVHVPLPTTEGSQEVPPFLDHIEAIGL